MNKPIWKCKDKHHFSLQQGDKKGWVYRDKHGKWRADYRSASKFKRLGTYDEFETAQLAIQIVMS